jgi:sarcosine oxidase subunit beta
MWTPRPFRDGYDVVIVGGGVHGLATAYYLAKRGVTGIAVLEKSYLGSGASGRNTAIIRSNYRTPEGVAFYDASVKLYEQLSQELDYNVLFGQHGHLTLGHTEAGITGLRVRAEVNQMMDVNSRMIGPEEVHRLVPELAIDGRHPVLGALYHPPGGIIRHDAVVWGYARGADRKGVHLHPYTEVTGIRVENGAVQAVETTRGTIRTPLVLNATAGYCSTIARMVGVELPVTSHPLQAFVTEPLRPWLKQVIVSAQLHVYVSQSDRGELVIGSEIDPYTSYSTRSTLPFLEAAARDTVALFPSLKTVRVLRQWAGVCDMTPDYSPIMGPVEQVKGFYVDVGWGTYGFKAGPISGTLMAEAIATRRVPPLLEPFQLERFYNDNLVGEKAAAAVSH